MNELTTKYLFENKINKYFKGLKNGLEIIRNIVVVVIIIFLDSNNLLEIFKFFITYNISFELEKTFVFVLVILSRLGHKITIL